MGGSESSQSTETQSKYSTPWRITPWGENESLEKSLKEFKLTDSGVKHLKILVIGEIGAGKSSFINSVNSVFQRRITNEALANKTSDSTTIAQTCKTFYIRNGPSLLPFVLTDTMGLESEEFHGIQEEDIVKVMKGHVKDRYKFNPAIPISPQDESFRSNPTLEDQTHCLVYVIAADKISLMSNDLIKKMKYIKVKAAELEIPPVIITTRVDEICPLVKNNLRKIYNSKRIKEKMEACSEQLGIPMSHVFAVKCYHEEIDTQKDIDVLILRAVTHIVQVASDALTMRSAMKKVFLNEVYN